MNLKAIRFSRFKGEINEWSIEGKPIHGIYGQWLTFEDINLIVGKNASGKSRSIDAIRQLADLVSGDVKLSQLNALGYGTAEYSLEFDSEGKKIDYYISKNSG